MTQMLLSVDEIRNITNTAELFQLIEAKLSLAEYEVRMTSSGEEIWQKTIDFCVSHNTLTSSENPFMRDENYSVRPEGYFLRSIALRFFDEKVYEPQSKNPPLGVACTLPGSLLGISVKRKVVKVEDNIGIQLYGTYSPDYEALKKEWMVWVYSLRHKTVTDDMFMHNDGIQTYPKYIDSCLWKVNRNFEMTVTDFQGFTWLLEQVALSNREE